MIELEGDERLLWMQSDALERWLVEKSDLLYDDPKLEAYLTDIAKELLGQILGTTEPNIRVHVLRSPELNAYALPNGALFLHTGILARMDNEAQLAVLIGHELAHFTHRHQHAQMHAERRRMLFGTIFGSLLGAALGGGEYAQLGAQLGGQSGQIFAMASVTGYSRNREREADEIGLKAAASLGYDPREGIALFEHLRDEIEAYDLHEKYFFSTHPRIVERIESFNELMTSGELKTAIEPRVGADAFSMQIVDLLLDNAELDLAAGREESAHVAIDRHIELEPDDARGYLLKGEYLRHVGRAGRDYGEAIASYERAIQQDVGYADAYLALGLIGRVAGDADLSRGAFERYAELRPNAIDRPIVESYLGRQPVDQSLGELGSELSE